MAENLHVPIEEVLSWDVSKFVDWMAYFHIKQTDEAAALKKGRNKGKAPKG